MSGFNDFMDKASEFAVKAAGKAKDLAAVASAKTKQVSRVAKLNMDISAKRDTIKKAYGELGQLYYEANGTAPEGPFVQACREIDLAKAAIAAMEEEIAQIKADMADSAAAQDADFSSVVDATEAEADVEVEVTVEQSPEQPEAGPASQADEPSVEEHTEEEPRWE